MKALLKRISQSRRGVGTVLGTVMFLTIMLFMVSGIVYWTTQKQSVMASLDKDRMDEQITVIATYWNEGEELVYGVELHNKGSIEAKVLRLWIINHDSNPQDHKYIDLDPPISLPVTEDPLSIDSATMNQLLNQLDSPFDPAVNSYSLKVLTERGNIASSYFEFKYEGEPPSVSAFGIFSLDWFIFNYASKQYPMPSTCGSISKTEDYISFYVKVTNNYHENVTIRSESMLMLLIDWQEPLFYIVEDVGYSGTPSITAYNNSNPITVGPGESVHLVFAAKNSAITSWAWGLSLPIGIAHGSTPEGAIAMVALVFTFESDPTQVQAQSLPFRALVLN